MLASKAKEDRFSQLSVSCYIAVFSRYTFDWIYSQIEISTLFGYEQSRSIFFDEIEIGVYIYIYMYFSLFVFQQLIYQFAKIGLFKEERFFLKNYEV